MGESLDERIANELQGFTGSGGGGGGVYSGLTTAKLLEGYSDGRIPLAALSTELRARGASPAAISEVIASTPSPSEVQATAAAKAAGGSLERSQARTLYANDPQAFQLWMQRAGLTPEEQAYEQILYNRSRAGGGTIADSIAASQQREVAEQAFLNAQRDAAGERARQLAEPGVQFGVMDANKGAWFSYDPAADTQTIYRYNPATGGLDVGPPVSLAGQRARVAPQSYLQDLAQARIPELTAGLQATAAERGPAAALTQGNLGVGVAGGLTREQSIAALSNQIAQLGGGMPGGVEPGALPSWTQTEAARRGIPSVREALTFGPTSGRSFSGAPTSAEFAAMGPESQNTVVSQLERLWGPYGAPAGSEGMLFSDPMRPQDLLGTIRDIQSKDPYAAAIPKLRELAVTEYGLIIDPKTGELMSKQEAAANKIPAYQPETFFWDTLPKFASGGKMVTNEPIVGVGLHTGRPQFTAGEVAPEMIDIQPIRRFAEGGEVYVDEGDRDNIDDGGQTTRRRSTAPVTPPPLMPTLPPGPGGLPVAPLPVAPVPAPLPSPTVPGMENTYNRYFPEVAVRLYLDYLDRAAENEGYKWRLGGLQQPGAVVDFGGPEGPVWRPGASRQFFAPEFEAGIKRYLDIKSGGTRNPGGAIGPGTLADLPGMPDLPFIPGVSYELPYLRELASRAYGNRAYDSGNFKKDDDVVDANELARIRDILRHYFTWLPPGPTPVVAPSSGQRGN